MTNKIERLLRIHKGYTINIKLNLIDKILQKFGYVRDSIVIREITEIGDK